MRNPSSSSSLSPASSRRAKAVTGDGNGNGGSSSSTVGNKTTTPCCSKVGLKRGPWTPEEDELLSNYIKREGEGRWRTLPKKAGLLRCGKSCRLRWMNYLRPSVKRGHIAPDEEDLILRLHRLLGNRWSLIAGRIPGRTDNEIKNYWNTHLSKKLISQGIDPRTHKPLESTAQQKVSSHDHDHDHQIQNTANYHISPPLLKYSETAANNIINHDDDQYQNDDAVVVNFMQNTNAVAEEEVEVEVEDMNNCCTDDVFSSFLNSLINEDVFNSHQNNNNNNNNNNINVSNVVVPNADDDPLIYNSSNAGWVDADPIMEASTSIAFDQNHDDDAN